MVWKHAAAGICCLKPAECSNNPVACGVEPSNRLHYHAVSDNISMRATGAIYSRTAGVPGCTLGRLDNLRPVQQVNDLPCCQAEQRLLQLLWLQRVLASRAGEQVCEGQQGLLALRIVLQSQGQLQ